MRSPVSIAILSTLALGACEVPLEIEGLEVPTQLVIDGRLQAGQAPSITVSALNALGQPFTGAKLEDSQVKLQIVGGRSFTLEPTVIGEDQVSFSAPEENIIVGTSYRLSLDAPGFSQIRSQTTVPRSGAVSFGGERPDSASYRPITLSKTTGLLSIGFVLSDPSRLENFYHVIARSGVTTSDIEDSELEFAFAGDKKGFIRVPGQGIIFSDEIFSDDVLDTRLIIKRSDVRTVNTASIELEVRSVTPAYYDFFKAWVANGGAVLPTLTTEAGIDNVVGGRGVFASYSSERRVISIDN